MEWVEPIIVRNMCSYSLVPVIPYKLARSLVTSVYGRSGGQTNNWKLTNTLCITYMTEHFPVPVKALYFRPHTMRYSGRSYFVVDWEKTFNQCMVSTPKRHKNCRIYWFEVIMLRESYVSYHKRILHWLGDRSNRSPNK